MNHTSLLFRAGSLITLGLLATACSNAGELGSLSVSADSLEQPNGGFTTARETVDFADPAIADLSQLVASDADSALPPASLPGLVSAAQSSTADATTAPVSGHLYQVLVVWGHLPGTPRPDAPTDWSGGIAVQGGQLSVRRTINFEPADHVLPRTDPARVDFVSHTLPFVDGLALRVHADGDDAHLVLHLGGLTGDFSLAEIDRDGVTRELADGSNGVHIVAFEEHPGCARGAVFGQWRRQDERVGGFRGRVVAADGAPEGAVRGIFGTRRDGSQVFFGKHVAMDGEFAGLVRGTWGDGTLRGEWAAGDPARHGTLVGRYFEGRAAGDGEGLFVGHYRADACR
jgi:hypothetical protein